MADKRLCNICKEERDIDCFGFIAKSEKQYRRNVCNACKNKQKSPPDVTKRRIARRKAYIIDPTSHLCQNYKMKDRKLGRENDITLEYMRFIIAKGCSYCGSKDRVGLDRIDNNIGHTITNVIPSCARCNYLRRDMDFGSWIYFLPAIKAADKNSNFRSWKAGGIMR